MNRLHTAAEAMSLSVNRAEGVDALWVAGEVGWIIGFLLGAGIGVTMLLLPESRTLRPKREKKRGPTRPPDETQGIR